MPVPFGLTPREVEVIDLLLVGASTASIVRTLTVERATVANHIASIIQKTHTHSRVAAVAVWRRAHGHRGQRVLALCAEDGMQLTDLEKILVMQALAVSESGCTKDSHQFPPHVEGRTWRCLCGEVVAGASIGGIPEQRRGSAMPRRSSPATS